MIEPVVIAARAMVEGKLRNVELAVEREPDRDRVDQRDRRRLGRSRDPGVDRAENDDRHEQRPERVRAGPADF